MNKIITIFILFISTTSFDIEDINSNIHDEIIVELPQVVEVIKPKLQFGLESDEQLMSFIKYLKTQSSSLRNEIHVKDVYAVIQTMFNRLNYKKCTWSEYYNSPKLNNSKSIKLLRLGKLKQTFSWNNKKDLQLYNMVYNCLINNIDDKYIISKDVLYFESFKTCPNRGPHKLKNIVVQYRHRFYTD